MREKRDEDLLCLGYSTVAFGEPADVAMHRIEISEVLLYHPGPLSKGCHVQKPYRPPRKC